MYKALSNKIILKKKRNLITFKLLLFGNFSLTPGYVLVEKDLKTVHLYFIAKTIKKC